MALNATVQKNPSDEREEDPIRTMQKDIATLQRGEYKPRHFIAPKPVLQSSPTSIWETKEDEQNALQRLEQSEFKPSEEHLEKDADEPPTLAEIGAQLAKKQTSQQIEPLPQKTPAQETTNSSEIPQKSLPVSEFKDIPEIDILGLTDFVSYTPQNLESPASSQDLPLMSDTENRIFEPEKIVKTPKITPPPIENAWGKNTNSQNLKNEIINKEDEHNILDLEPDIENRTSYENALSNTDTTTEIEPKKRFKLSFIPKKFLLVGIVVFVGILAATGGYIIFSSQNNQTPITVPPPPPAPAPVPPPALEEPLIPQATIPTSLDITLVGENINEIRSQLVSSLSDLSQPNTLSRILMKLETANEIRYLNFKETLSVLNLVLPTELKNSFDFSNTTLFTYGQAEGTRLGLAIRTSDKNSTIQSATAWEPDAYEDSRIMLSYSGIAQVPEEMTFFDNVKGEITIRYLNLLSPNLTIDYAITDTLFIFTTSRESMFAALEAIGK